MCFKEHGWSIVIKAYEVQKLGHKLIPNTSFLDETLHFRIFGLFTCNILQPIPIQTAAMWLISLDWTSFPPSVEIFPVCASTFSIHCQRPKILHTSDRNHKPLHDSTKKCVRFVLHVLRPTLFWYSATVTRCPETHSWSQRPMPCVAWANFLSSSDWEHTAELLRGSMQSLDR